MVCLTREMKVLVNREKPILSKQVKMPEGSLAHMQLYMSISTSATWFITRIQLAITIEDKRTN